jgi:hypothetical protein
MIADTQAARMETPSCAALLPIAADRELDQAPAVLPVPRRASTAGSHGPGAPVRSVLRVLPVAHPSWFRGLVNPRYLHLLETEDGQPRMLDIRGHAVGVAVCHAWLTGTAEDSPALTGALVCGVCRKVAADTALLRGAR